MKKCLFAVKAAFSLLLLSSGLVVAQPTTPNLVTNGDFEQRNSPPHGPGRSLGQSNIGPLLLPIATNDDLQYWYRTAVVNSSISVPHYIASDGQQGSNTSLYGITAHNSVSCILIGRHDATGDKTHDDFLTQELSQTLSAGHLYHVEFWALRMGSSVFHTKLAISITSGNPTYDGAPNSLIPSPGNKVLVSPDIQQYYTWVKVAGDIFIPSNDTGNNKWLTIGNDRSDQTIDYSLPDNGQNGILFAIDDVSLVDRGIPCPSNLALTAYVDGQQIAPSSTPGQGSSAEVNIYTPVTFGVSGNYVGTCTWSVYTSAGPYSYTSSTSGNTFTITPRAPQSPTAPGGATNSAQYYGITCTVTYPGCGTSSNLEFGLYSKQSNSGGGGGGGGDQGDPDLGRSASTTGAYPNPAAEAITIPEGAESATLVDDKGKVLGQAGKNGKVDVQSLPDGLYNLQIMRDGKLINQRIQVKH